MTNLRYRVLDGIKSKIMRALIMFSLKGNWWIPNRGMFRLDEARKIKGVKQHAKGEFATDGPWLARKVADMILTPDKI